MPLSHMPLGLQVPLVASSIGVSRFWLYQTMSPGLRLTRFKPQAFKSQFPPLATAERLTLGARTRTSIRRFANKQFLSDWNLEFPVIDLEPQNPVEALLPIETESPLQVVPETIETESTEPSTTELDSTEAPHLAPPQLKLLHLEPAKPHNQQLNSSKQKQRKPEKLSNSQTKPLQPDETRLKEQIEDKQFMTDVLNQDEQWTQLQPERWHQAGLTDELPPIAEPNPSSEPSFQTELPEVALDSHLGKNLVEPYAQKFFDLVQADVNQVKQIQQQQETKPNLTELKYRQKTSKQKGGKQNPPAKKQTESSKLKKISKTGQNIASETWNLNLDKPEQILHTIKKDFADNILLNTDFNAIDNHDAAAVENTQTELTQNKFEQTDPEQFSGKAESSEPTIQSPKDSEPITKVIADTASTDQLFESQNSQILESLVNLITQQKETPVTMQGFSVGGQVKATTTSAQPIDPSDTVPAMLTPDEFVVNATDAQKHLPLLHHINQGGSLEEATQIQPPKGSQITEHNFGKPDATALTHSYFLPSLGVHQPLVNSEARALQSNVFKEPQLEQLALDKSPELIFRSHQLSSLSAIDSSTASSTDSINEWDSIEELLQKTDTNISHSPSIYQSAINSQVRPTSTSGGLAASELSTSSPQSFDLQPVVEVDGQASANRVRHSNEAKTIEVVMETLAQEIYSRLRQRLAIERERLGDFSGRLPW